MVCILFSFEVFRETKARNAYFRSVKHSTKYVQKWNVRKQNVNVTLSPTVFSEGEWFMPDECLDHS